MPAPAVLSIDVEWFSQTPAYRNATGTTTAESETDNAPGTTTAESGTDSVSGATNRSKIGRDGLAFLRETLTAADATTTCFVVSSIADDDPDSIRALADDGFEIASHTHTHRLLSTLDPSARRTELARSKARLEAVTDEQVRGFRAPAFDVPDDHFDALADAGYAYDSSVVASRRIPGWYGGDYDLQTPAPATVVDADAPDAITELPVSVMPWLRLPLTGTWLRFFGVRYTILGMRWLARRGITPVLYVHPWEFVDLPAIEGVPNRVYWRTGDWMRRAVERILHEDFEFTTARDVLTMEADGEGNSDGEANGNAEGKADAEGNADGDPGGGQR